MHKKRLFGTKRFHGVFLSFPGKLFQAEHLEKTGKQRGGKPNPRRKASGDQQKQQRPAKGKGEGKGLLFLGRYGFFQGWINQILSVNQIAADGNQNASQNSAVVIGVGHKHQNKVAKGQQDAQDSG